MRDPASLPTAPATAATDPFSGAVIGERYRLLERLGEGGMGAVYRAEHTLMKKVVACKLLHPDLGQVEEAARRFEREAQSASLLSHPNIIAVTDFGRAASGELFLVMEYVPGVSLATALELSGRMPVARAVEIGRQMLAGLVHAHAQGVIHRDLKPANIMITPPMAGGGMEQVKILDFGIAKLTQGAVEGETPLTKGAMVFGTPSYMSPEQATAQEADARADIYACGIILYEMLTGRKPFVADDLVKVMAMQVTAVPPPFATAAPEAHIPAALEAVVMRALEKDRNRRFQTVAEFLAALGAGVAGDTTTWRFPVVRWSNVWQALQGGYARLPWPVRRWVPLGGGVLGVVLLLVLITSLFFHNGPASSPPHPQALAPAVEAPLRRIEEALGNLHFEEARALINLQMSRTPQVGRLHFLQGNLEFLTKHPSLGLDAYEQAIVLEPGFRGDAGLLANVRPLLGDKKLGRRALDFLIKQVGRPAGAALAEVASRDKRLEFRQLARDACGDLGCADKVDRVESYALDLKQARSCPEKRAAVESLRRTSDKRAIEVLKQHRASGTGFGGSFLHFGGGDECTRKEVEAALKDLGG